VRERLVDDQAAVAFLGQLEPRKNVPGLVRGWVKACADREDAPALVLVSRNGATVFVALPHAQS